MSRSSPSVLFTQYTDLFCDNAWEDLFTELFGGSCKDLGLFMLVCFSFFFLILHLHDFCILAVTSSQTGPWFISRDWRGIRPVIDAAIVGRVYTTPKPTSPPTAKKWKSRRKRPSKRRGQRRRQSRHDDFWFYDLFDLGDYSDSSEESIMQEYQSTPVQNVYFFKKGKSA